MHATNRLPPKPEPEPPYYLQDLKGGPVKEYPDRWKALMAGYLAYGMAKFRVMSEEEYLTQPLKPVLPS